MRTNIRLTKPLKLLIGVFAGALTIWPAATISEPVYPPVAHKRAVQFTYQTVVDQLPAGAATAEVWLPVPHNNPYQQITSLIVTSPYPYQIDSLPFGNQVLHIRLARPSTTSFTVAMQITAVRSEHVQPLRPVPAGATQNRPASVSGDSDRARWLQPDRLVPIDGQVKRWAQALVDSVGAKTDLEKARAIYNHVIATVKYDKTGTGWGRGDIYYACDARRGNCTDFHAIFIGYCRAVGIPARFAIGFSLPTDRSAGKISGYHCWAEFYLNKVGWVPIDASEAAKNPAKREYFFGAHDENRLEFTVGRDVRLYAGQAEPLNYFIYPYAEVDGKPFAGLTKTFTYRNVNAPIVGR